MLQAESLLKRYSSGSGKNYRKSSMTVYGAILGKLETRAIKAGETLLGITPQTIAAFLATQNNVNTAKRYAWFLEDFYHYFLEQEDIRQSPAFGLRNRYSYPEKNHGTTGFVQADHTQAFLRALPAPGTWKKSRDAALLAMSLGTGLKLKEMIFLDQNDVFIDQAEPVVLVRHAYGDRAVPIRSDVLDPVRHWKAIREQGPLRELQEYFPATATGGRLAPSTVWRHARKVMRDAGLSHLNHFGTSALRVSYARLEADEGSTLPVLQQRLGHKREISTQHLLENGARKD